MHEFLDPRPTVYPSLAKQTERPASYGTGVPRNSEVLMALYKTIVRPQVEYAVQLWFPNLVKDPVLLETVQ